MTGISASDPPKCCRSRGLTTLYAVDGAVDHADRPAGQQRPPVEPAGVEAEHDRREGLQDPDAAEQLEVDRVLLVEAAARRPARTNFTTSETSLETWASCGRRRVGLEPLLVDVAGEQVGRRDRHDRRRHQRADRDRREGDARRTSDGNVSSNSCGTTSCALGLPSSPIGLVPAAIAT